MTRPSCLVYDLYLDTLGGGERVVLAAAEALRDDFEVVVAAPILPKSGRLAALGMRSDVAMQRMHPARFTWASAKVDLVVYLANGIPLPSLARRSILLLQFPFEALSRRAPLRLAQRWILGRYQPVVYSDFVASWTQRRLEVTPLVVHPPAQLGRPDPALKEPLILSIGRFFATEHSKRQDVLIEAYRRLPMSIRDRWPLVLAGGVYRGEGGQTYVDKLRSLAAGENIHFETDVSQQRLEELLARATLFWHATGFGRLPTEPEKAEHFGLSTVEAMSWGVVPLVYADGGQVEIVTPDTGVLWRSVSELVSATEGLINDPVRRAAEARRAALRSHLFASARFETEIRRLAHPRPA